MYIVCPVCFEQFKKYFEECFKMFLLMFLIKEIYYAYSINNFSTN